MSVEVAGAPRDARERDRTAHLALAVGAALVAGAARLVPVLRGGGLTGLGNYDDGVYLAAGTALLHGVLPYRDYLFLHPPGIVLTLAPFGIAGLAGQDPTGLAAARLAWMLLGVVNTVLVARILRPVGLIEAAVGALFYATAFPAIYIEWTPLLEAPAQTCVLAAVLLLNRACVGQGERLGKGQLRGPALAGALLGLSATFKIWGVVALLAALTWLIMRRRWRPTAAAAAAGAAAAVVMVCLPFFLAAPGRMWQMVIVDQLGRSRASTPLSARLADIAGMGLHGTFKTFDPVEVVAMMLAVSLLIASAAVPRARLCLILVVALTGLLLASPSWFLHYPGLVTGPLAVLVGAGAGTAVRRSFNWRPPVGWAVGVIVVAVLVAVDAPLAGLTLGRRFPAAELAPAAMKARCVTSDDPLALFALNVQSRNLASGCRFVADPGGYSYQLASGRGSWIPRVRDVQWQRFYLDYLSSGQASLPFRYLEIGAVSPSTKAEIRSWRVLARSGLYVVRKPR